jgi:spore coat protein CotH
MRERLAATLIFLTAGTALAAPSDLETGLETIFDPRIIRTYEVTLPPADWQRLQERARDEQYVAAKVQVDGVSYNPVGLRFKGGPSTLRQCFDRDGNRICPKLSLKLKFSEYDPELRFHGVKRLNFNSMKTDPSQMREVVSLGLFRAAGVIAPRAHYAKLSVNGQSLGLFALIEQVDGRFTDSRFPDGGNGNLYKEVWPNSENPGKYLSHLETNKEQGDVDRFVRFANALATATDEDFAAVLGSWVDLDALMRLLAVDRLIDNYDGVTAWYCLPRVCSNHNYYWYEEPSRDRLWLIPWDVDVTFRGPRQSGSSETLPPWNERPESCRPRRFSGRLRLPPACDPLTHRLTSLLWPRYVAATKEILDRNVGAGQIQAQIDNLEKLLEEHIATDPYGPSLAEWRQAVIELKTNVTQKHARIVAKLDLD